jgi:hypothetical protein
MAGLRHFPPGVDALRDRFEKWRKAKSGRARIPAGLWSRAVAMCGRHGVNFVSEWLRLNHSALRDRFRTARRPKPTTAVPAFVEWVPPPGLPPSPVAAAAEYVVEVEGAQGPLVRVRARGAAVADVATLARLLGERAR